MHFSQDMEATHTPPQYFPIAKHIRKDNFMANLWLNVLLEFTQNMLVGFTDFWNSKNEKQVVLSWDQT